MAGKFDKLNDDDFEKEVKQIIKVSKDYEEAKNVLDEIRTNTNFEDLNNQIEQDEKRKKLFLWLLIGVVSVIVIVMLYLALSNKEKSKLDELTARVDSLTKLANNNKAINNSVEKVANINVIKLKGYDEMKDAASLNRFIDTLKKQGYTKMNLKEIENNKNKDTKINENNLNFDEFQNKIQNLKMSQNNLGITLLGNSIENTNNDITTYHLILGSVFELNPTDKELMKLKTKFQKYKKIDKIVIIKRFNNEKIFEGYHPISF